MNTVKKAVILAAGKGTRLYPFTSVIPKELFPIVDKPVIQYVLEEAIVRDIQEIILVINPKKELIAEYIQSNNSEEFQALLKKIKLRIVHQPDDLYGSGAGILAAREHLLDGPFLVLFGDSFALPQDGRIESLIKAHEALQSPIMGLIRVNEEGLSTYGIPQVLGYENGYPVLGEIIEKPGPSYSGERLAAPNGYIVTPKVFEYLDTRMPVGSSGEMSFPASFSVYKDTPIYGDIFEGPYFEAGNRADVVLSTLRMSENKKARV